MPYFGRVTLAQVLADPAVRAARTGAELVAVLDRLHPPDPVASGRPIGRTGPDASDLRPGRSPGGGLGWPRRCSTRTTAGSCTATSSRRTCCITGDGMPMLLDFNLAGESSVGDPGAGSAAPGGHPRLHGAGAPGGAGRRRGRRRRRQVGHLCPGGGPVRGPGQATLHDARRDPDHRRGPAPRGRRASRGLALIASRRGSTSPPPSRRWCRNAWLPSRPAAMPRPPTSRPTCRRWPTTARSASRESPSRAARSAGSAATAAPWPWVSPWRWPSWSASTRSPGSRMIASGKRPRS